MTNHVSRRSYFFTAAGLIAMAVLPGCGPDMTLMINPRNGQTYWCEASSMNIYGFTVASGQSVRTNCIAQMEAVGFVQAQKYKESQQGVKP